VTRDSNELLPCPFCGGEVKEVANEIQCAFCVACDIAVSAKRECDVTDRRVSQKIQIRPSSGMIFRGF